MDVTNELGVIADFARRCESKGWELVSIQSQFPDAIISPESTGDLYNAEFEYRASNFKMHGHDLRECDLIICWENDWRDCPLTIWELSGWDDWGEVG